MKARMILSLLILISGLGIAQDWSDKKVFSFDPVKPKYIVKENCKKVLINSFNIGYVMTARGNYDGAVSAETVIEGMSDADLQQLTDRLYDQFVDKWKARGYEVVDKKSLLSSGALAKDISKGKITVGGGNKPAFSNQFKMNFGQIAGFGGKRNGMGTYNVSYYVPTDVPNYGKDAVPMMQPGKVSKEFDAIVLDLTFVFNTVDFTGESEDSKWITTYKITFNPVFSTTQGGPGNLNTRVVMNYTSPKGFISLGTSIIPQQGRAFLMTDFVQAVRKEEVTEGHTKVYFSTTPEQFGAPASEWCGGFMDAFIKSFTQSLAEAEK